MPLLKLRCKKIIIYFVSSNKRSGDMLFKLLENQKESCNKFYRYLIELFVIIHKSILLFLNLFAIILIGFVIDGVLTDCYTM